MSASELLQLMRDVDGLVASLLQDHGAGVAAEGELAAAALQHMVASDDLPGLRLMVDAWAQLRRAERDRWAAAGERQRSDELALAARLELELRVECPYCGQAPGAECVFAGPGVGPRNAGYRRSRSHVERGRAARHLVGDPDAAPSTRAWDRSDAPDDQAATL